MKKNTNELVKSILSVKYRNFDKDLDRIIVQDGNIFVKRKDEFGRVRMDLVKDIYSASRLLKTTST